MKDMTKTREALKEVYSKKKYFLFSGLCSLWVFSLNAVIGNYRLLWSDFSLPLFFDLVFNAHQSMSGISFIFLIVVSLLSGIVFSLSIFLLKRQVEYSAGIGLSGIITSILTPACSSCALGLAGILGISGFLSLLPFKGLELGALGILMLLVSVVYLSRKITIVVCEVKK